jgi:hypothetical protein
MGICSFFLLLTIAGIVLLAVAVPQVNTAALRDSATDFESVISGCTILSVAYSTDQRTAKSPFCVDIYTYTFSITGDEANLTSGGEEHHRSQSSQCDDPLSGGGVRSAEYAAGATVPCWKPASGKDAVALASFYKCGNPACVKLGEENAILSPAAELARKAGGGQVLLILGAVFIAVGLVGVVLMGFCVRAATNKLSTVTNKGKGAEIVTPGPPPQLTAPPV